MKFKKGDYVKGTERGRGRYNYTDEHMTLGLVILVGKEKMMIKIIKHDTNEDSCIGDEYVVKMEHFDLYRSSQEDKKDIDYIWTPDSDEYRLEVEKVLLESRVNFALDHNNRELFNRIINEKKSLGV